MSHSNLRKKQRKLGYQQLELPGMIDVLLDEGQSKRKPNWYYLVGHLGQSMLADFDNNGLPIWIEHDLRIGKPHLYNSIHKANYARGEFDAWEVKRYPFHIGH